MGGEWMGGVNGPTSPQVALPSDADGAAARRRGHGHAAAGPRGGSGSCTLHKVRGVFSNSASEKLRSSKMLVRVLIRRTGSPF